MIQASRDPSTAPWWQTGVIYQIYLRSFRDSNGDGVGDLPGVLEQLDYISDLGVDGVWLSPVTVSDNADWGYDVTDYYNIDPALGTMDDFDELLEKTQQRGIKLLMDFVPNHTSVKHPWFLDALTGKHAEFRDFYIWADPKPDGRPPSNWRAYGGGSAWKYHAPTGQYYLHNFFKEQADLNWRNPAVRDEFDKIMRFWLDRGVAGFRLDVVNMLIKDAQYRDNPKATKEDGFENRILGQRPLHNINQSEVHEILRHWRKLVDEHGVGPLLGESTLIYDPAELARFYGNHDELELALNLAFIQAPFEAGAMRKVVAESETAIAAPDWPVWAGSNHDNPRFPTRWGKGDERIIRCALLMLLTLRGTPILYYGDELGMMDAFVAPWRMKDPRGRRNWPVDGGRDKARTPMPWQHKFGAGFTTELVRPWLPYGDLGSRNVENQTTVEDSTLHFTKDLIALRKAHADLHLGRYQELPAPDGMWSWNRGDGYSVAINLTDQQNEVACTAGTVIFATSREREGERVDGNISLRGWQGVIIEHH